MSLVTIFEQDVPHCLVNHNSPTYAVVATVVTNIGTGMHNLFVVIMSCVNTSGRA